MYHIDMDHLTPLINFYLHGKISSDQNASYSENRGQSLARLSGWKKFCELNHLTNPGLSQLIACLGELTNNSYDHNIGHWHDLPGCYVSWSADKNYIRFGVADRGRGIINSLKPVLENNVDENTIMSTAFEKVVSGRSPEQRGNGLKFIRAQILSSSKHSLFCISANKSYKLGIPDDFDLSQQNYGTFTLINWSIL